MSTERDRLDFVTLGRIDRRLSEKREYAEDVAALRGMVFRLARQIRLRDEALAAADAVADGFAKGSKVMLAERGHYAVLRNLQKSETE